MRALAMVDKRGFLASPDISMAVEGLDEMDCKIDTYDRSRLITMDEFKEYDLFLGGVDDSIMILNKITGKSIDHLSCYPEALDKFLGRKIKTIKMIQAFRKLGTVEFFMKPKRPKLFAALCAKSIEDGMYFLHIDEDADVYYTEDILDFKSEWRVYVQDKKVKGVYFYRGDWSLVPSRSAIKRMIKEYWYSPICYALDVGIVKGKTILVEVNDFYSIGNYGLDFITYAEMLLARWDELTRGKS